MASTLFKDYDSVEAQTGSPPESAATAAESAIQAAANLRAADARRNTAGNKKPSLLADTPGPFPAGVLSATLDKTTGTVTITMSAQAWSGAEEVAYFALKVRLWGGEKGTVKGEGSLVDKGGSAFVPHTECHFVINSASSSMRHETWCTSPNCRHCSRLAV